MKQGGKATAFNAVKRLSFHLAKTTAPPSQQAPGVDGVGTPDSGFYGDGMVYPRPSSSFFDKFLRVTIAASTTLTQTVFRSFHGAKGGWLRGIGYDFDDPEGFFAVKITPLVNGGPSNRYAFATIDPSSPLTVYEGSLPPFQIGSPQSPANVFIYIPANGLFQLRFVNGSADAPYTALVRLTGWTFEV